MSMNCILSAVELTHSLHVQKKVDVKPTFWCQRFITKLKSAAVQLPKYPPNIPFVTSISPLDRWLCVSFATSSHWIPCYCCTSTWMRKRNQVILETQYIYIYIYIYIYTQYIRYIYIYIIYIDRYEIYIYYIYRDIRYIYAIYI